MIPGDIFSVNRDHRNYDVVIPRSAITEISVDQYGTYPGPEMTLRLSGPETARIYIQLTDGPVLPEVEPQKDETKSVLKRQLREARETIEALHEEIEDQLGEIQTVRDERDALALRVHTLTEGLVLRWGNAYPRLDKFASGGVVNKPKTVPGIAPSQPVEGALSWT